MRHHPFSLCPRRAGYRSSLSLVEPLKLGIFTSALVSDVDDHTVWTVPALEILVPAVLTALWRLKPPTPPPTADDLRAVGSYYDGSVKVGVEGGALLLRLGDGASPLNLTRVPLKDPKSLAFRAAPTASTEACRQLDDGQDQEIAYFSAPSESAKATRLDFMAGRYERYAPKARRPHGGGVEAAVSRE